MRVTDERARRQLLPPMPPPRQWGNFAMMSAIGRRGVRPRVP